MLPEPITEQQQYDIALAFAAQLDGIPINQAVFILKDLAPALIINSHAVNKEAISAAKERLLSGGSV